MKAQQPRIPSIVHHKASGQAVVFLRQPDGQRRMVYLGPYGSSEAASAYRAILAEHLAGRRVETVKETLRKASEWPSVASLVAAFLLHCERHYVDETGRRSKGVVNFVQAMRPFLEVLRELPTDEIDLPGLELVQQHLVDSGACNRATINGKLRRIRQCIRWGVKQKLVPAAVWHEVSAMQGLGPSRAGVRESRQVEPVPRAADELRHLQVQREATNELSTTSASCCASPSRITTRRPMTTNAQVRSRSRAGP